MKLAHIADLHLGKKVNDFSMLEDQKYILTKILNIIDSEKTDGVIIAGDIYDKPVPPVEAVELLDDFLNRLIEKKQKVYMVSGNHDSSGRVSFGARLLSNSGLHISGVYDGDIEPVNLRDEYGECCIWLLPFVKPVQVRHILGDDKINDYNDALKAVIEGMKIDTSKRNILVAHQFVTGALRSDSEEISIGGLDDVSAEVFDGFDYVALGHIHRPQHVGRETVRYCGTPLKYSFSEVNHNKSVTLIELKDKGDITINTAVLTPLRDMCEIKGTYDEVTAKAFYDGKGFKEAYLHVTLTDENDIPEAIGRLRAVYPYTMKLDYDNTRTRNTTRVGSVETVEEKTPYELFSELFKKQNGVEMSSEQEEYLINLIEKLWNEEGDI